ncbi:GNAT family N-acetyltransferase [Planomonospora parontospora]|uniref:GNAT family N-acetyltransferase n=1 Tax=Planomonospora parontospora TaxID=58119 RepID=UPI0035A22171
MLPDEEPAGSVTYTRARAGLSLLHTEIDPRSEGRGPGSALARGVLEAARAGNGTLPADTPGPGTPRWSHSSGIQSPP